MDPITEIKKALQWALDNTTCEERLQSDKFNILANAIIACDSYISAIADAELQPVINKIENEWIDWCFTHAGRNASNHKIGEWFVKKMEASLVPIIVNLKVELKEQKHLWIDEHTGVKALAEKIDVLEESCERKDEELKKYGKFCDSLIEAKNTMIIEQHQEIKSLKEAIKEYEEDIPKLGNTILSLNKDVTGFAEWMDKEHYTQVLNQFHPEFGKWCKRGLGELHRPYFSTPQLLSKYIESKKQPA